MTWGGGIVVIPLSMFDIKSPKPKRPKRPNTMALEPHQINTLTSNTKNPNLDANPKPQATITDRKWGKNIKNNLGKYIQRERSVRFRGFHIDLHVVILLLFFWWLQILAIRLKKVASDGFGVKVTGISSTLKRVRPPLKEEMDVNMDVNIQEGMWEKFVQQWPRHTMQFSPLFICYNQYAIRLLLHEYVRQ